jgi:hypothetical protein
MYVLLYIDTDNQPSFIQGSITEINEQLQTRWLNHDIDRDDWEQYDNWQLLGFEDGRLTRIGNVECSTVPHFEVY